MAYIPLTVRESDASPTAPGVREIIVTNASLTTGGAGIVTIATGAGSTGGGTLTVAEADGSPSVSSVTKLVASSAFTVTDDSSGQVTLALGASSSTSAGGGGMTLIADVTSTAAVASLSPSTTIPGTYKHLLLYMQAASDQPTAHIACLIRFNGDTGANYDWQILQADNNNSASATLSQSGAQTGGRIGLAPGSTVGTANGSGVVRIDIPNYATTTFNKLAISNSREIKTTGFAVVEDTGVHWRSAAAVTAVTLFPSSGNFVTGSRATLYGLA